MTAEEANRTKKEKINKVADDERKRKYYEGVIKVKGAIITY
jgi:hypothetical protein